MGLARKELKDLPCNKPRKTPGHNRKSHVVKGCQDGKEKTVRFGEQGADTVPNKPKNEKERKKKKSFLARHNCDTAKDKLSARYWSCKHKW